MIWQVKRLEEIANFNLGKMLDDKKNKGEPLPYLANVNVRWGEFELNDLRLMRFEASELEKFSLKYGDIVMCEGGEPGRCAIWKEQLPKMMYQKALHRIRPNKEINNKFLYYAFLHKGKRGGFSPLFTGSTIKHLPKEKLAKVEVEVPELMEQQRIAEFLSKYDDLIENNKRRIELLEKSARQLYKEWFVRFRFPGHEHVKIIDGIPEGWDKKHISALCSFLGRGMTPSYDDEGPYTIINQKCIRNRLLSLDLTRRQSKDFSEEKLVKKGDVLINSTGTGTLGRVAQCWIDLENCTVDTHVTIARPKANIAAFWFGYCLLELETIFEGMGEGATNQKELKRDLVGALQVIVPPKILRQEFDDFVCTLIGQISNLVDQNRSLVSARNILLPKLMSREIAV